MSDVVASRAPNYPSIKLLIQNEHTESFWEEIRGRRADYSTFRKKTDKRQIELVNQPHHLTNNTSRINQIYSNNILSSKELINTITSMKRSLITKLNIPHDITLSIVSYVGFIIPITYSLSYLPFFYAIREHELYRKTLKKWWVQTINTPDHRGIFYPKSLQNAAREFQQFFTGKLAENGVDEEHKERVKYHRYMIPQILLEMELGILQKECCADLKIKDVTKGIQVSLPTASGSSACVGGIELFQRLYLETVIHPEYVGTFNVDLTSVDGNHGDNWCFDGNGDVLMADGTYKKIFALQIGDNVCSFPGNTTSEVKCIVVSNIYKEIEMVELSNNCWITFEHPILIDKGMVNCFDEDISNNLHSDIINKYNLCWVLPKDILPVQYRYQDKIYNFVLDSKHTLNVNGNWCCTLGHDYKGYVIEHEFWGDSTVIERFLMTNSETYPYVIFG